MHTFLECVICCSACLVSLNATLETQMYCCETTLTTDTMLQEPEIFLLHFVKYSEARGSVVVKALCYKPVGRGFDTR
jgi:hypothetical protein